MNRKPYWKKFFICKRILVQISVVLTLVLGCQVDEGYTFVYTNHTQHQITLSFYRLEGHVKVYTFAPESSISTYDYRISNAADQKAVIVFDDQKIRTHTNHRNKELDCSQYNSLYCIDSYNITKNRMVEYDIRERDYDEAAEIQSD